MRLLILVACLTAACSRAEHERRASALEDRPAGSGLGAGSCSADADCTICSNGECGVPLGRAAASANGGCNIGALCEPWVPVCEGGRCQAAPPPVAQRCRNDADCGMCMDGSRCGQPMSRARIRALGDGCERSSAAGCRALVLLCQDGRCKDASLLNM